MYYIKNTVTNIYPLQNDILSALNADDEKVPITSISGQKDLGLSKIWRLLSINVIEERFGNISSLRNVTVRKKHFVKKLFF